MGCGSCGTGADGKPGGCKGNGGCSTGGCNRLNVYDWLSTLPLHDAAKPYPIVEMSFSKGSRKEFFKNNTHHILEKGGWFAVEGVGGYDIGQVSLTGELVKLQLKKYGTKEAEVTKRILHPATVEEIEQATKQKDREPEVLIRSRAISRSMNLDMKLCEVEIQADSKKGTFFYTADQRVDFRELIRVYATEFKMKVEMKQIGARQESGKVGGIGSCGRELCCSTWLTDFKSVNTTAARYQNLSINQTKLSGQCGRLKCCLNYELDTYMDALSVFPDHVDHLETVKGMAHLQKRDIFKNLMWYSYSDNNKQYPLSIERVKEIQKLNKLGQKADELQPVELETRESKSGKVADMGYVNDVGTITLKALENKGKKKKSGGNKPQGNKEGGRPQGGQPQGNRPQGARPQGNRPPQVAGADGAVAPAPGERQQNRPQQARPQGNRPPNQPNPNQQKQNQPRPQQNRPQQGPKAPAAEGGDAQAPAVGGEKPQVGQPRGNRPQRGDNRQQQGGGNRPQQQQGGDRPQQGQGGNRPQGNRPPRGPRPERGEGNRPAGGGDNAPKPEGGV